MKKLFLAVLLNFVICFVVSFLLASFLYILGIKGRFHDMSFMELWFDRGMRTIDGVLCPSVISALLRIPIFIIDDKDLILPQWFLLTIIVATCIGWLGTGLSGIG